MQAPPTIIGVLDFCDLFFRFVHFPLCYDMHWDRGTFIIVIHVWEK
jgi:hypothetical protein